MTINSDQVQFPIFDGHNFSLWHKTMQNYFITDNLWKYLQYKCDLSIKKKFRKDNEVLEILFCIIDDEVFSKVYELTTSKSVWDILISTYRGDTLNVFDIDLVEHVRHVLKQVDYNNKTKEDSNQMHDHLVIQESDPLFEGENESYDVIEETYDDLTIIHNIKLLEDKIQVQSFFKVSIDKVKVAIIHLCINQASISYRFFTAIFN